MHFDISIVNKGLWLYWNT